MIKKGPDEKRIKRTNNLVYVWLAASSQQLAARRAVLVQAARYRKPIKNVGPLFAGRGGDDAVGAPRGAPVMTLGDSLGKRSGKSHIS